MNLCTGWHSFKGGAVWVWEPSPSCPMVLEHADKLSVHPLARKFLAATVCVAVVPVFWFSTTVPCVMIRMAMFLSVASDR